MVEDDMPPRRKVTRKIIIKQDRKVGTQAFLQGMMIPYHCQQKN